ncbi:MAG: hypothetical protein ACM358_05000 [Gemmatimonadota bacterium]
MTAAANMRGLIAARHWTSDGGDEVPVPAIDQRPHAFTVLFGAFVIRVAADGTIVLVALPWQAVRYLRTGVWPKNRPGAGRPRLVVTEPESGVMRVREVTR